MKRVNHLSRLYCRNSDTRRLPERTGRLQRLGHAASVNSILWTTESRGCLHTYGFKPVGDFAKDI